MVHELYALVVCNTEAIRDIGYNWLDTRKESSPIIGDNIQKNDVWIGDDINGRMVYAFQFSLRFRTQTQRTTIKSYFTNTVIPNSLAGIIYQHVCNHDTNKPCEQKELVGKWFDSSLTETQKQLLINVFEGLR